MGVRIVDATVHDALHHLFKTRKRLDLGIGEEIELVDKSDGGHPVGLFGFYTW